MGAQFILGWQEMGAFNKLNIYFYPSTSFLTLFLKESVIKITI